MEKERREKFGKNVYDLGSVSRFFTKQPIYKNRPILEIHPGMELDTDKLLSLFPPKRFVFSVHSSADRSERSQIKKQMKVAGFEEMPPLPDIEEESVPLFS